MRLIYTGDGKGKTSSAAGIAFRAWGQNRRVLFISFLKAHLRSGELKAMLKVQSSSLVMFSFGRECPYEDEDCCPGRAECIVTPANIKQTDFAVVEKGISICEKELGANIWDLVVLDEIINVYNLFTGLQERIVQMLADAPEQTDLILTGRNCPPALMKMADMVSEIKMIKHPFKEGTLAKRGIDY